MSNFARILGTIAKQAISAAYWAIRIRAKKSWLAPLLAAVSVGSLVLFTYFEAQLYQGSFGTTENTTNEVMYLSSLGYAKLSAKADVFYSRAVTPNGSERISTEITLVNSKKSSEADKFFGPGSVIRCHIDAPNAAAPIQLQDVDTTPRDSRSELPKRTHHCDWLLSVGDKTGSNVFAVTTIFKAGGPSEVVSRPNYQSTSNVGDCRSIEKYPNQFCVINAYRYDIVGPLFTLNSLGVVVSGLTALGSLLVAWKELAEHRRTAAD